MRSTLLPCAVPQEPSARVKMSAALLILMILSMARRKLIANPFSNEHSQLSTLWIHGWWLRYFHLYPIIGISIVALPFGFIYLQENLFLDKVSLTDGTISISSNWNFHLFGMVCFHPTGFHVVSKTRRSALVSKHARMYDVLHVWSRWEDVTKVRRMLPTLQNTLSHILECGVGCILFL